MKVAFDFPKGMALVSLSLLLAGARLPAATTQVNVGDNFFSPAVARINVNDSINWVWMGFNPHSSTHTTLWNSGTRTTGQFSRQFTSAGNFPYFCTVHANHTGAVIVASINTPPTVMITSPANEAVFSAPATINILASASDPGGSVNGVEFRRDGTSLGTDASSPYRAGDTNVPAGRYVYSAVATDSGSLRATNQIVVSVVTAAAVQLSGAQKPSATQFRFNYTGNAGLSYRVERSVDLVQWQILGTNTAFSGTSTFVDSTATAGQAFYRVGRLPNP